MQYPNPSARMVSMETCEEPGLPLLLNGKRDLILLLSGNISEEACWRVRNLTTDLLLPSVVPAEADT